MTPASGAPKTRAARVFSCSGAVLLALATLAGAFGSHALRPRLTTAQLETWHTAVEYQFFHALGLLAIGLLAGASADKLLRIGGYSVLAGVVCFSGSLYALALLQVRALGVLTPVGGTVLILGWLLCAVGLWKVDRQ